MECSPYNFRLLRLAELRRRVATGSYDNAVIDHAIDVILEDRGARSLLADLQACPIGEGDQYRDLVIAAFVKALRDQIDVPLLRRESPAGHGRIDVDLPIAYKALGEEPLFRRWHERYRFLSLIIEVKNERKKGSVDCYRQVRDYLENAGLGRVACLVCRSGFSRAAMTRLRDEARKGEWLVLPLSGQDMLKLSEMSPTEAPEWLHRKEVLLRQSA